MKITTQFIPALAALVLASSANAALTARILDLSANGGINPNTGLAWAEGDKYRLAFVTSTTTTVTSNSPAFYDTFVNTAASSNTALSGISWKAMVTVNLDSATTQALSPKSEVRIHTGTDDVTGGAGVGGAGVPVYAMNGTTAIARNNADIWNGWSNPFSGDTTTRVAGVFYSPWLDQDGAQLVNPDANHGRNVATGYQQNGSHVNALGNTTDTLTINYGSSNANNAGRITNRFTAATSGTYSLYAISEELTVTLIPEPSSALLGGIGLLALLRRRR